jgi:hypothetical protein
MANDTTTYIVAFPGTGEESAVEIGQSMVLTGKQYVTPAIKLDKPVTHFGRYNDKYQFVLTVPAGLMKSSGMDEEGKFYESPTPIEFKYRNINDNTDSEPEFLRGGIYVANDSTQPTEVYWFWEKTIKPALNAKHPGIVFNKAKIESFGKDSFKRELVYTGISQNTISILYREFINDFARPAYSQDLKYDISRGNNLIGYGGARFQVIKADNINIRYKVIKPLD